jgi:hypothetical protein
MSTTTDMLRAIERQYAKVGRTPPANLRGPVARPRSSPLPDAPRVERITVLLPIRTHTESNTGGHYMTRAKAAKRQRAAVTTWLLGYSIPALPVRVTLTRLAPGVLDRDNAWSSMKRAIDGIADAYGVEDNDPRIKWADVKQEKSATYGVRVTIEHVEAAREASSIPPVIVAVEEDGDEIFTPIPAVCGRFGCGGLVWPEGGFHRCAKCGGSYGPVKAKR